jgi:VanZ family protein
MMADMRKRTVILWTVAIVYTFLIFNNSLQNGASSSNLSEKVTYFLLKYVHAAGFSISFDLFHHYVRKLAHFLEYFLLAVLVLTAVHLTMTQKKYMPLLSFWLLVPCIDESIQHFIPGRFGSLHDVCIDMAGYLTGLLFTRIIILVIQDIRKHLKQKERR